MRVLVVEQNRTAYQRIRQILASRSIVVEHATTVEDALTFAQIYAFDLILLERDLPDGDGLGFVRSRRAAGDRTPMLVLAMRAQAGDKVAGLNSGADDYLAKPYDPDELLARLNALVRRAHGHSRSRLEVGAIALDLDAQTVTVAGQPVPLSGKQYKILEALAMRQETVVSREALLDQLYDGLAEPNPKILDVFVCKLRKTLGAGAGQIRNVWGRGYVLTAAAASASAA
jgi:two-component system cell cycle response regulator CtrA